MGFWVRDQRGQVMEHNGYQVLYIPKREAARFDRKIVGEDHRTSMTVECMQVTLPTLPPAFRNSWVKPVLIQNAAGAPYFWVYYQL